MGKEIPDFVATGSTKKDQLLSVLDEAERIGSCVNGVFDGVEMVVWPDDIYADLERSYERRSKPPAQIRPQLGADIGELQPTLPGGKHGYGCQCWSCRSQIEDLPISL